MIMLPHELIHLAYQFVVTKSKIIITTLIQKIITNYFKQTSDVAFSNSSILELILHSPVVK